MTFPNFLVIGASRCGTTWLHDLLATHPAVYMSEKRKEVNFFTTEFERGWAWYDSFFPVDLQDYIAIGESTPTYLYSDVVARRIAKAESIRHLVAILRNPLDRLLSDYFIHCRYDGYAKPLQQFLTDNTIAMRHSLYSEHLSTYRELCRAKPLTILITEEATRDISSTKVVLGKILGIDPALFPDHAGRKRINERTVPRLRSPYAAARKVAKFFRDRNLDHVVNLAYRSGVNRFFGFRKAEFAAPPPAELLRDLAWDFLPEVERVEQMIGRNLDIWRNDLKEVANSGKRD